MVKPDGNRSSDPCVPEDTSSPQWEGHSLGPRSWGDRESADADLLPHPLEGSWITPHF